MRIGTMLCVATGLAAIIAGCGGQTIPATYQGETTVRQPQGVAWQRIVRYVRARGYPVRSANPDGGILVFEVPRPDAAGVIECSANVSGPAVYPGPQPGARYDGEVSVYVTPNSPDQATIAVFIAYKEVTVVGGRDVVRPCQTTGQLERAILGAAGGV
ncbi:MAG: hypothetical protein GY791_04470 [Alphaproteobacteria bacterium]|nr:hypothetical protein [Alphaproteobacteria bacterium]